MAKFYAVQIRLSRIALEDVPERWREQVKALLEKT